MACLFILLTVSLGQKFLVWKNYCFEESCKIGGAGIVVVGEGSAERKKKKGILKSVAVTYILPSEYLRNACRELKLICINFVLLVFTS